MFVGLTNTPARLRVGFDDGDRRRCSAARPSGGPEAEVLARNAPGLAERARRRPARRPTALRPRAAAVHHEGARRRDAGVAAGASEHRGRPRRDSRARTPRASRSTRRTATTRIRTHKPEMIYALSDPFDALCGFRPVAATRELLAGPRRAIRWSRHSSIASSTTRASRPVFEWLITRRRRSGRAARASRRAAPRSDASPSSRPCVSLARDYPGDPGILISLLLNHVTVRPGRGRVPAGRQHPLLPARARNRGARRRRTTCCAAGSPTSTSTCPSCCACWTSGRFPCRSWRRTPRPPDVTLFRPDVREFELAVIQPSAANGSAQYAVPGDFVALATRGSITIGGGRDSRRLELGEAMYGTADDSPLTVTGDGTLFVTSADPHPPRH